MDTNYHEKFFCVQLREQKGIYYRFLFARLYNEKFILNTEGTEKTKIGGGERERRERKNAKGREILVFGFSRSLFAIFRVLLFRVFSRSSFRVFRVLLPSDVEKFVWLLCCLEILLSFCVLVLWSVFLVIIFI
jgi:hypothetical protein